MVLHGRVSTKILELIKRQTDIKLTVADLAMVSKHISAKSGVNAGD